jgi:hypothetical protein
MALISAIAETLPSRATEGGRDRPEGNNEAGSTGVYQPTSNAGVMRKSIVN